MPKDYVKEASKCEACNVDLEEHLGMLGTCAKLQVAQELLREAKKFLSELANEDYRGNRSMGSQKAFKLLQDKRWEKI